MQRLNTFFWIEKLHPSKLIFKRFLTGNHETGKEILQSFSLAWQKLLIRKDAPFEAFSLILAGLITYFKIYHLLKFLLMNSLKSLTAK